MCCLYPDAHTQVGNGQIETSSLRYVVNNWATLVPVALNW